MTEEELKQVETIVNEKIAEALPVETSIMSLEEAKKQVRWHCLVKNTVIPSVW